MLKVHPDDATRLPVRTWTAAMGLKVRPTSGLPPFAAFVGTAVLPEAPSQTEGYALRITPDGVAIQGHDARGLVWGLATLAQILTRTSPPPCCEIDDWPEYGIRYHHDDISRKQVSTREDFRRIVRHLASFKVSHYSPYLEDMLTVDAIPLMGEGRGALTPDDVRDLVAEGERWQVEVFPTLSLAGHQENLLQIPRYRGLGAPTWQPPSSLDPRNPAVREHLLKLLDAACPLFPSPLFHMAFDEVIGLDVEGFVLHANWCAERLVERGKTPLMWADMLYNHFGCDLLQRLHPAIVPVAWDYRTSGGRAREALPELLQHREKAWILAGYNTWCSFFHAPLANIQQQWAEWRRVADPRRVAAFGASQWGDNGYENHRDLGWAIFAACAEQGWSGDAGEPESVEARFQTVFHGHPLPSLTRLRRLLEAGLAVGGARAWNLHRLPAEGWTRLARAGHLPTPAALETDILQLAEARRLLSLARRAAVRERDQLDHCGVAIDRLASVVARARAAHDPSLRRAVPAALARARRSYRAAWLAHNRPENIEVSLAVFDAQAASWRAPRHVRQEPRPDCVPLDLKRAWNVNARDVAGLPIGLAELGGTHFRFAPETRTHAELAPGTTVSFPIPALPLRDIHLVATQPRDGEVPRPGARLRLFRQGRVVYEEDLLNIRHLCDWWAPLGEHMWAGGGMAYTDPLRVRYLMSPGPPYYGLTCVSRFPWPAAPVADHLELTVVGTKPLQLFAITLETANR